MPTEELKPVFGKAWINFEDLLKPGETTIRQRVYLETCPPINKKANDEGTEEEVEETEFDRVFEEAKTYINLKIELSQPIVPKNQQPEPSPNEIVPIKQFVTWPYSKDPCDDFGKQVTLAVESLAKEFFNMFKQQLQTMVTNQNLTEQEIIAKFDDMKKEFFYEINT